MFVFPFLNYTRIIMAFLIILNIALLALIGALIVKARKSVIIHRENMELLHSMIRDVLEINKSQALESGISEELDQKLKRVKMRLLNDMEELIREFLNAKPEKTE